MRKHLNLWNVFIAAVVILTAAWIVPRANDATGPPGDEISVQANDMGLGYFETTVRSTPVAADDPADYTYSPAILIASMAPTDSGKLLISTDKEAVIWANTARSGTRPALVEYKSSDGRAATTSWGGMLRMVSDTASRTVPVA